MSSQKRLTFGEGEEHVQREADTARRWPVLSCVVAYALLILAAQRAVAAVILPIEFKQLNTTYNLQSQRGVPISKVSGTPPGSDGRLPDGNESGSLLRPTTNQFQGFTTFGAIVARTNPVAISQSDILNRGTNAFSTLVAAQMQLPAATDRSSGEVIMILRRGNIGAPYLSRQVSFAFGAVVAVPTVDEYGNTLTNIAPEAYWNAEPFSTNSHLGAQYYWSPHARKVYAIQPGPLNVTWVKTAYTTTPPSTNGGYYTNAGNYFKLHTVSYLVSGAAVKTPRKIYWTERGFRVLGKPVAVPAARVGGVNIVYNENFPKTVASEFIAPGDSQPTDGTTNQALPILRTLWYDQQQGNIYAYNREGRVFMELLGDARPDGQTREQLGIEIVDIFKQPIPLDVTTELGDRLLPPQPGKVEELTPEPVLQTTGPTFAYEHNTPGGMVLYAAHETANANDYLVHWMEEGEVGLKWPFVLGRYQMIWPNDPARFSHYIRPEVSTENEAKLTAVPLPTQNVPTIQYQDRLDKPRAKLTETFQFYTFLDWDHPVHRTLLRFSSGEYVYFERVFSWLNGNLAANYFYNAPFVTNMVGWNTNSYGFDWADESRAPRVVNAQVEVGQRINPPSGETGSVQGEKYLAGYIRQATNELAFSVTAYIDPFVAGFDEAAKGSIIPVNSHPEYRRLEVWWFRKNNADAERGFRTVMWPSVLGQYFVRWPEQSREIVLASLKGSEGSGPLNSFEAAGEIYYQNNPNLPGYNPNEEHAIISGGTVFATRDDLNRTDVMDYSSDPYVLLQYKDADGRPSMSVFKVLREKPEAGWVFDYIVEAGKPLQPPMPLPLLAKPVEGSGENAINYNVEPRRQSGDLPGGWVDSRDTNGPYAHYQGFTYKDRKEDLWVFRGPHSGLPEMRIGSYNATNRQFGPLTPATAVVGQPFRYNVHASRQDEFLGIELLGQSPEWLMSGGLTFSGIPKAEHVGTNLVQFVVADQYEGSRVTNTLTIRVVASGQVVSQGPLSLSSSNAYTGSVVVFSNRPPFLAAAPDTTNSFTMRFYYKTEPSFAWPGISSPPPAGSIVPYLRPRLNEGYAGDPAAKSTPALDIVYRPVWPERDPKNSALPLATMPYGLTLTMPQLGLPGIKDFKTARVLYQQSIATNLPAAFPTVVLHDPTREKVSDLKLQNLARLPGSVRTDVYQGRYYFPNLPPHLAQRVYYDANRGPNGSLVLKGEFHDEILGQDYLLLNVLRDSDLAAVLALCPQSDSENYPKWAALVNALATALETFQENPSIPGTYKANPNLTTNITVGELAQVASDNSPVDSYALSVVGPGAGFVTLIEAGGTAFTQPGDPVSLHVLRVEPKLFTGELKILAAANPLSELITFQHNLDLAGRSAEYEYEWKIAAPVDGIPPVKDETMSRYLSLTSGTDKPRYLLGGAGIQVLGDNYITMRYRPVSTNHPLYGKWSGWTEPQLAEGWIKRVLAGLNPFNQRINDLFNNPANTDASILSQAGHRWEGDVALNLDTINNYGLIEIYETVLRRGRLLSIESGYNYGPANDALLLAAGYLNDLYMMHGNEAFADAANPTIGIGTANNVYGDIATALFSFKGQMSSLLDEELALLRGRDDFLQPGVQLNPVYNRLIWNYTRGIDAGEVIYALNYNIKESPGQGADGVIDAADAARMFPQGHGDAYGHYLTALKGYYSLLMDTDFDWVPRTEAVLVLGQPVQVDYQDERKFAAAAAAVARSGRQVFDLTWRKDYQPGQGRGWSHLEGTRVNTQRSVPTTRYWGLDHWASRTAQGAYYNWIVGNAILPATDPNPNHEGIQKIDRKTVPELAELAIVADGLNRAVNNAEGGLTPVGLPENSVALDINPNVVVGSPGGTHFEQIYDRAKRALNNALAAFDDAKDVTRIMRSEQDSLAGFQAAVAKEELAFTNALIEIYGTPYTDDIGPGKTYKQGYAGPDIAHYFYVETPESTFNDQLKSRTNYTFKIDMQSLPSTWAQQASTVFNFTDPSSSGYSNGVQYLAFTFNPHDFYRKPEGWSGKRVAPGKLQQAISDLIRAHNRMEQALTDAEVGAAELGKRVQLFNAQVQTHDDIRDLERDKLIAEQVLQSAQFANDIFVKSMDIVEKVKNLYADALVSAFPESLIAGVAAGGDMTSAARAAVKVADAASFSVIQALKYTAEFVVKGLEFSTTTANQWVDFNQIAPKTWDQERRAAVVELGEKLSAVQGHWFTINNSLRALDDAKRNLDAVMAEGDRIQQEREIFRQRSAAVTQGYRTRDAAFRIFRNEKLERYKTLFDLASQYSFLAATAYDYETGLLDTSAGRDFVNRIVSARSLGVVRLGEPQYAGSNTGDPGLSSALAEMKADWDVLRGRLGFNSPDAYGTTVSLRTENFRILQSTNSDSAWKDVLQRHLVPDLMADSDVQRYCMQVSRGSGLPTPGIVIEFSTTIADGFNLFGRPLAPGDHAFSPSSFATKIFGVGAALEGYRGMDDPTITSELGGASPTDPNQWYLDPTALAATPYIYLVPVGVDSMRSPPLGDASGIRTWDVADVAVPLPFNIGASALSDGSVYLASDSLSEPIFTLRKHQAFRPVSSASYFSTDIYSGGGDLARSQFTNNRLIGRSAWNSRWKLVIPGHTLLNDPNQGLERFINTVRDVRLHFVTYSYSGN